MDDSAGRAEYALPVATCPSCGFGNSDGARFCNACGGALAAAPAREVRKTITVLFADVTGSTALGEQLDPESLRRVMARYFETAKECLERHGGSVEKFVASALALWKLRILLAGLFLPLIIAAAMRPSVEWMAQRRIPRGIGILLHYALLACLIGLLLWAIVPRAIDQVDNALGGIPTSSSELERQTSQSTGFKHEILARVQDAL